MLYNIMRPSRPWLLVVMAVLILSLGARFSIKMGLSGDEPHYLVMAHSLKVDQDLNLKNDYELRRYHPYYKDELAPHINPALAKRSSDVLYSIHSPGLPILILPGVLVSKRLGPLLILAGFGLLAVLGSIVFAQTVAGRGGVVCSGNADGY